MNKEKFEFYMTISFALLMGLLSDYLFYKKEMGISFFVFILAATGLALAIARKFEQKLTRTQTIILVLAIALSAGVFLRANPFLTFFNKIGSIYLLSLAAILAEEKDFFKSRFSRYVTAPILFFLRSFTGAAKFIGKQRDLIPSGDNFGSKEFRGVAKGVIMALPILFLLGWFLYSADLVVQAYLNRLIQFKIDLDLELILRLMIIFAVSYVFVGVFNKIADKRKIETTETDNNQQKRSSGFIESMTVLVLVELLFLAFIAIQFYYLFGGKSYVWGLNEYITYSEYAKNGFYELIKVSIVSFLLIYAIDRSSKIESPKEKETFRFLSATLFIEISVILISALKRLLLYTDGYGLTMPRFLAFALLFWIFFVFFFFLCKLFLQKKNSAFLFAVFSLSIAVWIGINIANPDTLIAKVNLERFNQGKKLDPYYISRLSEDAMPEIVKIFKLNVDEEVKEKVAMDLDWQYATKGSYCSGIYTPYSQCQPLPFNQRLKEIKNKKPWQSFNLSKTKALAVMEENSQEIEKYLGQYWNKEAARCKESCGSNGYCDPESCKVLEKEAALYK